MAMKYVGKGRTIVGPNGMVLPRRNLTDEEEKLWHRAIAIHAKRTGEPLWEPEKAESKTEKKAADADKKES